MKISFYALHLGVGGVEKYVSTLANMLAEEHEVEIISTYKIQDEPAFDLSPEINVHYLIKGLKPNKKELLSSIKSKRFLGILKEMWTAIRVLVLKYKRNIESLKRCDSDVIISTRIFHNKLIGKYAGKDIVKITGEHNHHNDDKKYIDKVIESCRNFDYFIPISKELYEYYYDAMAENGVTPLYIRFCIDDNPVKKYPAFDNNALISVGRMSHEKGIYDLLQVFEMIHRRNENTILHIVGDGEEYEQVAAQIKERKLENAVVLHGFQNKEYIYRLLPRTSLYVMTSYTESFGIVLLEAMSCGVPCIAYSSAQGAHEIIEDGENGFLIQNRDCKKMQEKVCELLDNKEELHRLSKNALKTADMFSYDKTKEAWLELMKKIANEKETHL